MRRRLIAAGLLASTSLGGCAGLTSATGGSAARTVPDIPAFSAPRENAGPVPAASSDLIADPVVTYGRLANGLRYAVIPNDEPKDAVSLRLRIGLGSVHEAEDERGLAHFIEHMAFNGTTNVAEGEMVPMLERHGLAFGADTNASTGYLATTYRLDLPNVRSGANEAALGDAFFLLREVASEVLFERSATQRERGVIEAERRTRNGLGRRANEAYQRAVFPDAALADRSPIGTPEVIGTAPAERLRALYERAYRPDNAVLVIAGAVEPGEAEARIREAFGDWAGEARLPEPDLGAVTVLDAARASTFVDPDATTGIALVWPRPFAEHFDDADHRLRHMLESVGTAIVNRRVRARLEDGEGAVTGAGLGTINLARFAEGERAGAATSEEGWAEGLALVEQAVRRAREHGFTREEVETELRRRRAGFERAASAMDDRRNGQLAGAAMSAMVSDAVFEAPDAALARFDAQRARVTPEAVHAAWAAQFTGEPFVHLATAAPVPEEDILAAYEASRAVPVSPPVTRAAGTLAYRPAEAGAPVAEELPGSALGERRYRFGNAVRLTVLPTPHEADKILVMLRVGNGQLALHEAPQGLRQMAGAALTGGGLGAHEGSELEALLAGRKLQAAALSLRPEMMMTGAATTQEELADQLALLMARLTDPAYRPEREARFRKSLDRVLTTFDANPGVVARTRVPYWLYAEDDRFGTVRPDAALDYGFEDAAPLLRDQLTDGYVELLILGDVTQDRAVDAVARTFGTLPPRRAEPQDVPEARRAALTAPGEAAFRHRGEADKAVVSVVWPTTDSDDADEATRLYLLSLAWRNRLKDEVRERLGAAYSPGVGQSTSSVYDDLGTFSMSAQVEPARTDEILAAMRDVAYGVGDAPVTRDELDRVRRPILEKIPASYESNGALAGALLNAQAEPERVDRWLDRERRYEAVTPEALAETARRYLKRAEERRVLVLPEETPAD